MIDIDLLKAEIARPGLDEAIAPLLRFRGHYSTHNLRSRWLFINAMMIAECESLDDGTKLSRTEIAHLCGVHAKEIPGLSLGGICNRIRQTPKVAALVPGLMDYVSWVNRYQWDLEVTGICRTLSSKNKKVQQDLKKAIGMPGAARLVIGSLDNQILAAVHEAVPITISRHVRNDLCQDLVCAVIAGDVSLANLRDAVPKFMRDANKFLPRNEDDWNKYGRIRNMENALKWAEQYQPKDERTLDEKVADLAEHWGCHHVPGDSRDVPV